MKAGRPSSTALLIARSTVVASANPGWSRFYDPLGVSLCKAFLQDHLALAGPRLALYSSRAYRWLAAWFERLTLPGIQLHYALRKRFIENEVRSALGSGYGRVEIHGAGFDTLATRLAAEFPAVRFLEVDHPDTQQAKRYSLARLGRLTDRFAFQAIDLDGRGVPVRSPADTQTAVVVVAEGVLMYLSETAVQQFFAGLHDVGEAPVRVVFTFMAPDRDNRLRFHKASRFVDLWLDLKGEPFTWGIAPNALGAFLDRCGFTLECVIDHDVLRRRYLDDWRGAPLDLAEGELIAVAVSS
jgi:methyltransferase (TIGR00027 family)